MRPMRPLVVLVSLVLLRAALLAGPQNSHGHKTALDQRGQCVMGFDQAITAHHFILTTNGGRIEVTANDPEDAASIEQIRSHLRHIATMFGQGNFEAPMLVHAAQPPGVGGMKAAGGSIVYRFGTIERGARITIVASSPPGIDAVHEFLRFQIRDHATGDRLMVR
jgi:hypothetical protein